ncbi:helix-turn-helix domain-containing protein [Nocardiopsis tropica]|uniref:Helix-turn-helix domain-containing protein n=1 Tax=Nocardiopsis tropica TaxID=109330 RepID=A0ABU7KM45_9ACTN|nr:helix-turn-helix domain-containing protein [Nocardiopsis umidischolae]MEE2050331.1 helix-turn-helix domain-containing protein [Nocardiopsis umidischolae]
MPKKVSKTIVCVCGCGRTGLHSGRGLINSCWHRESRAGRLDQWPPRPVPAAQLRAQTAAMVADAQAARDGRIEDYIELREWGHTRPEAAARMGVTLRTLTRWHNQLRKAGATHPWLWDLPPHILAHITATTPTSQEVSTAA